MTQSVKMYRLAATPAEAGLCCRLEGLTLGGVPLLRRGDFGLEPRCPSELQRLLDAAYGNSRTDFEALLPGIGSVARALNKGDLPLAMTASVLMRLPEFDKLEFHV